LLLCLFVFGAFSTWETYDNLIVIRLQVTELEDLEFLANLFENNRSLDFWTEPYALGDVDILLEDQVYVTFREELVKRNIHHIVWIDRVKELIEEQMAKSPAPEAFFDAYHSYAEIYAYIDSLKADPNFGHLLTTFSLGKSYEGRDLVVAKISTGGTKRAVWWDGGIHAREWISPATCVYILDALLRGYQVDPDVTKLVDGLDFYMLPIHNPDGYEFSWTAGNRMWRKTRRPNSGSSCVGTDANRNYNYRWNNGGSSANPCSETFHGPNSNSEPEVTLVSNFICNAANRLSGYISFHSYSQLWMTPWGWTTSLPSDYSKQNALSAAVVAAIRQPYGTSYRHGSIANTIYVASGNSVDTAYSVCGIVYACTPELRDTGSYGFILPPSQIIPSGRETFEGFKVYADQVLAG